MVFTIFRVRNAINMPQHVAAYFICICIRKYAADRRSIAQRAGARLQMNEGARVRAPFQRWLCAFTYSHRATCARIDRAAAEILIAVTWDTTHDERISCVSVARLSGARARPRHGIILCASFILSKQIAAGGAACETHCGASACVCGALLMHRCDKVL